MNRTARRSVCFATMIVLGLCLAATGTASAQSAAREYRIAPQSLDQALREFALASNLDLLFSPDLVAGKQSSRLDGKFTVEEGLRALLRGSGLEFSVSGSRVVISRSPGLVPGAVSPTSSTSSTGGYTRLVQTEGGSPRTDATAASSAGGPTQDPARAVIDEIVITGTRINGATPASPVRIIGREEIDRSGYSTTGELIRSLPQAFAGNINPGVTGVGNALGNNFSAASSADLRGLGPAATLTLLNGHRMAYNGKLNTADISIIPLSAVERIDVLLDGASALYGSDAVAGVVNFILRKDYEGAETTLRLGATADGGASQRQIGQLLGHTWSTGNLLASVEYSLQDELHADQRDFSRDTLDPTTLIPRLQRKSVFVAGNQDISSWLSTFVEALYTEKEVKSAFTYDIGVLVHSAGDTNETQYGATGGFRASLPGHWKAELAVTASENKEHYVQITSMYPVFPRNTVNTRNEMQGLEVNTTGRLFDVPAGTVSAAIGGGVRREQIDTKVIYTDIGGDDARRDVKYGYAELSAPLLAKLRLSASARYEDYSDFGSVVTPKLGLIYTASEITLRGTWGESFRTPALLQLYGQRTATLYPAQSLQIPGAAPDQTALNIAGVNPNLEPEHARSWTVGFDYAPRRIDNLKLTATYYKIHYGDKIGVPLSTIIGIFDSPLFQQYIIKNPSAAIQSQVTAGAQFQNTAGMPYDPSKVLAVFVNDNQNISAQYIDGIDVGATYSWKWAGNALNAFADASYLELDQENTPGSPRRSLSGTVFYPPTYKARGGVEWSRGAIGMTGAVNYVDGSIDNSGSYVFGATVAGRPVDSWTTVDAQLTYDIGDRFGLLGGTRITLSMTNVFNTSPPRLAGDSTLFGFKGLGYDSANASPLGRFTSLTIRKQWGRR